MKIVHDAAKEAINFAKHGISLTEAAGLDWGSALIWPDRRKDYGEPRQAALAAMGNRLYFVAFVDRAGVRRVISLRKANQREFDRYASYLDPTDR